MFVLKVRVFLEREPLQRRRGLAREAATVGQAEQELGRRGGGRGGEEGDGVPGTGGGLKQQGIERGHQQVR